MVMSANILKFSVPEKNARVLSMKKTLPFKTIKKKNCFGGHAPDLYLILRFLCVPLEEAHVPLVVRVPHFENHCFKEHQSTLLSGYLVYSKRSKRQGFASLCINKKNFSIKDHTLAPRKCLRYEIFKMGDLWEKIKLFKIDCNGFKHV